MKKENSYRYIIEYLNKEITRLFNNPKLWRDDKTVTELYQCLYDAVYSEIHSVLVPCADDSSEKEIREIIAKYVIGYVDGKTKYTYIGCINPIKGKIAQIKRNNDISKEYLQRYIELYDNFLAIASFRSFKHYCIYMQTVFNFTLWEDTVNCFSGYWYYSNKQILDRSVKFIEKQLPTGYGKSLSDAFKQSWEFGVNPDTDIFKVCGNDKFTDDCFTNVIKLMTSPQYAKVFPWYAQFNCRENDMFSFCSRKDLKFAISGSKKSTNLRIITKLSDSNGVRAEHLYFDDITQRRDMSNMAMHEKDKHAFLHEWFERNYCRENLIIDASGTTYSQFDFLSDIKHKMGGDKTIVSNVNKYTRIGKSDFIVPNGVSVFISVPLLDFDTGESTYPKKISTQSALLKKATSPTEFWAMDMQQPLPPDDSPFYFTKLREYTTLPKIGEYGRIDSCVAALDTKRRGKDFLSMPIFFEADDFEHKDETAFYLTDWLYDDRPMKECLSLIVSKIIQHKITRLYVERNTDECIETLIQDRLKQQKYTSCIIEEVYSTEPKDRRIMAAEGDIKSKMIFPQFGMYAVSNNIGKALQNVYGYSYKGKVDHDDAPDSLALFAKRFITNNSARPAKMSIFKR